MLSNFTFVSVINTFLHSLEALGEDAQLLDLEVVEVDLHGGPVRLVQARRPPPSGLASVLELLLLRGQLDRTALNLRNQGFIFFKIGTCLGEGSRFK